MTTLVSHLVEEHDMLPAEYMEAHPDSPLLMSEVLRNRVNRTSRRKRRACPPDFSELTVRLREFEAPVNWDVPGQDCLPLPDHYRFPRHGKLGEDVEEALISLICGRVLYIWGMPGSGKDAFVHAYNHERTHQGKRCQGRTPMATFVDALPLALDKQIHPPLQPPTETPPCMSEAAARRAENHDHAAA